MPHVPAHIFRAYDIRGTAESEVGNMLCILVGKAFGSELRERYQKDHPVVIVGRDARTHSPKLEKALIEGLIATGCWVKTIGQTPSPVNYFALCHFGADGSVQVTASHNPGKDNGLKLQTRQAEAFSGDELQGLRRRIEEERFLAGEGTVEEADAVGPYREKGKGIIEARHQPSPRLRPTSAVPLRGLKIVTDFGNGVAGPVYGSVLKELGIDLIELYADPDGTFPNHIADPSMHETLKDLIETVKRESADLGLAFDGDGDRVGVVDEKGNVVNPDYLLLLLAEDHLKRNPGATIIYTVSMSSIIESEVKRLGGKAVMCTVGHSFVEHAMHEHGSHLGGEQSGHFFCGEDYYDFDDALVASLRLLSLLQTFKRSKPSKPLSFSTLLRHFPRVFQSPEWRPHCPDDEKAAVIERITKHFQDKGYPCITIDGVRVDFGSGAWAGIRMSNTSPKISVCMEAQSEEELKKIETIVRDHLATYEEIEEIVDS